MNRDDYMDGRVDHETYYLAVGDAIGREAIERLALQIAPAKRFAELTKGDNHLNNIPLRKWDAMHYAVRNLVLRNGRTVMAISWSDKSRHNLPDGQVCWSLSETVCVLKASARRLGQEWLSKTEVAS